MRRHHRAPPGASSISPPTLSRTTPQPDQSTCSATPTAMRRVEPQDPRRHHDQQRRPPPRTRSPRPSTSAARPRVSAADRCRRPVRPSSSAHRPFIAVETRFSPSPTRAPRSARRLVPMRPGVLEDRERGHDDQHALDHRGEELRLVVPVWVVLVGRPRRVATAPTKAITLAATLTTLSSASEYSAELPVSDQAAVFSASTTMPTPIDPDRDALHPLHPIPRSRAVAAAEPRRRSIWPAD